MSAGPTGPHTTGHAQRPFAQRKDRDRALIVPVVGAVALLPPMAAIFQLDVHVAGIPFTLLYLFTVWALLIAATAALSRRLSDEHDPDTEHEAPGAHAPAPPGAHLPDSPGAHPPVPPGAHPRDHDPRS